MRRSVIFCILIAMLSFASNLFAGGYEGPGLGTRAISMGGAFIGVADDWSAAYWNPAGLSFQKKRTLGFSLDAVTIKGKDSNSAANPDTANLDVIHQSDMFTRAYPTEPDRFEKEKVIINAFLPGLGFVMPTSLGTLGFSIYEPVGYGSKWNNTVSNIDASYRHNFYLVVYNLSIAKEFTSKFSGGLGLDIIQGKSTLFASKKTTGYPLDYNYKFDMEASGTGFEEVAGLMFKPNEKFSCGAVYRTGASVKAKGSTTASLDIASVNETSDFTQKFRHPETMGIGLSYKSQNNLQLSLDWQRTKWSGLRKDISYDNPQPVFLKDQNTSYNWKDGDRWRIGMEYLFDSTTSLRAGFFTDPLVIPREDISLTNVLDVDKKNLSFGVGFNPSNDWILDVTYLYTWGEEENTVRGENIKYSKYSNSLQMGVKYSF